ncbi:MAG: ATP-binding protein, partial [Victivallaceae bacterium]
MVELTIEAVPENLEKVNNFVRTAIEPVKCAPRATMQLLMAVEEIFVNIAHYAYNPGKGPATISCEVRLESPVQVTIKFIDGGMPYNPLQKQDPDTSLAAEERD